MMVALAAAFALTAFIYSLAGFAGGSTYLALLVWFGVPTLVSPIIALTCNAIVSSIASARYVAAGLARPRLLIPHMALAIPMAYIGGRMEIGKTELMWVTATCLFVAALYLLLHHRRYDTNLPYQPPPLFIALPAGAALGLVSGVIGIGGGIFLSPLLYSLRAGTPKEIAATSSLFIFVNSLAGIAGHLHKTFALDALTTYWPLPVAVFIGGAIGCQLTLRILSLQRIALATGTILMVIALRQWWALLSS